MRGKNLISLFFLLALLPAPSVVFAVDNLSIASQMYQDGDFSQAMRFAQKDQSQKPLGRLIVSLCHIYDKNNQNIRAGIQGLRDLYVDRLVRVDVPLIWAESALSYARVIQVLQARKRHPEYDQVDIASVYREIVAVVASDVRACTAAMYLTESYFSSNHPMEYEKGFSFCEKFIENYTGEMENLTPLHIYLEGYYINIKKDYEQSFKHLREAYEIGINKEILARVTLFRLGRMCDIKLNEKKQAKLYYKAFLSQFPDDQRASVVRRYLKELIGSSR